MVKKRSKTEQTTAKATSIKDFRRISGVGIHIAENLWELGFRRVVELREKDPEQLYENLFTL